MAAVDGPCAVRRGCRRWQGAAHGRHPLARHGHGARHVADPAVRCRLRHASHRRLRSCLRRPLPVPLESRLRQPAGLSAARGRGDRHHLGRRTHLLLVPSDERVRRTRRIGRHRPVRLRPHVRRRHPGPVRRQLRAPRALGCQPADADHQHHNHRRVTRRVPAPPRIVDGQRVSLRVLRQSGAGPCQLADVQVRPDHRPEMDLRSRRRSQRRRAGVRVATRFISRG